MVKGPYTDLFSRTSPILPINTLVNRIPIPTTGSVDGRMSSPISFLTIDTGKTYTSAAQTADPIPT